MRLIILKQHQRLCLGVKQTPNTICTNYKGDALVFKKYRKIFAVSALFLTLIVAAPLVVSLLFNKTTVDNGKIIINKQIEAPFLSGVQKNTIALFFGYVGCAKICVPTLSRLNDVYESPSLKEIKSSTAFVFVNLTPDISKELPQIFAGGFNKEFIGLHLNRRELLSVDREFALFYSDGIADKSKIAHSDFVYLIKRENGKLVLKNIYMTHPLNPEALMSDIKNAR